MAIKVIIFIINIQSEIQIIIINNINKNLIKLKGFLCFIKNKNKKINYH